MFTTGTVDLSRLLNTLNLLLAAKLIMPQQPQQRWAGSYLHHVPRSPSWVLESEAVRIGMQ